MTKTVCEIYKTACDIDARIYHCHDPELLPVILALKIRGKKVVFDMHENVGAQIRDKTWIPKLLRSTIALLYQIIQILLFWTFDSIVLAEACYSQIWLPGCRKIIIKNYPMYSEFHHKHNEVFFNKEKAVCYVGGITFIRGAREMIKAAKAAHVKLLLAGSCDENTLKSLSTMNEWKNVVYFGNVDRDSVVSILFRSMAGLVVLHPTRNYMQTEPTKMYEYMAAGIPVIASNFPKWEKIIEENNCGICCDPMNPEEIAKMINWIIENKESAKKMGENGRRAVENSYTWELESEKLVNLYHNIMTR
jgi:glycosyltransferase involved in cell wall biosynthesis